MTGVRDVTHGVRLRSVEDRDLDVFFDHQVDPKAIEMAAFPARDKDQFAAPGRRSAPTTPWLCARSRRTTSSPATSAAGRTMGGACSGYWVGREYWGRGVATKALARFVEEVSTRPLYAHVAVRNVGSIRVLDKVWLPTRSRAGGDGAGTRRRHRGSSSSCYGRSAPRPGGQERIPWSGPRICRIEYASGYSSSAVGRTQPGHRRQPIWIVTLVVPVRPSRPAVNVMECAPGVSPNTSMMAPSPSGPSTEDAQWSSSSSGSRSSR